MRAFVLAVPGEGVSFSLSLKLLIEMENGGGSSARWTNLSCGLLRLAGQQEQK